jgi:hypothetical protein
MALTDIFTGQPQIDAAAQQRQFLNLLGAQEASQLGQAGQTGTNYLLSGQGGALDALRSGYGAATGYVSGALNPALSALQSYGGQATGALIGSAGGALDLLRSGVTGATGAYAPVNQLGAGFAGLAGLGSGSYADALGLNGPEGIARAQSMFTQTPGYQFQLGQGIDALTRAANASGAGTAGGNVLRAAQDYGQGLASTTYNDWLNRLSGLGSTYSPLALGALGQGASGTANALLTGGTGGANILTGTGSNLANILSNLGINTSNLYTGNAAQLAGLATGGAGALSGVYTGTGQNLANLTQGLAGLQSGFYGNLIQPYMNAANAQTAGAGNLVNAIGGIAQLAAGGGYLPSGGYTPYGTMAPRPVSG